MNEEVWKKQNKWFKQLEYLLNIRRACYVSDDAIRYFIRKKLKRKRRTPSFVDLLKRGD